MQTINFGFESTTLSYCFNFAPFGIFFAHFSPFRAIFGLGWGPKRFLTPINVDYQFWFWNYSPIFFFHSAQFGVFLDLFGPFGAFFGVGFRSKNFFGTYLHSLTAFVLEVCGFYSSFILFWVGGWVGGWLDQLRIQPPQPLTKAGVWAGAELGKSKE